MRTKKVSVSHAKHLVKKGVRQHEIKQHVGQAKTVLSLGKGKGKSLARK